MPAKGFDTLDFEMDDESMAALVDSGRRAMREYLATRTKTPVYTGCHHQEGR